MLIYCVFYNKHCGNFNHLIHNCLISKDIWVVILIIYVDVIWNDKDLLNQQDGWDWILIKHMIYVEIDNIVILVWQYFRKLGINLYFNFQTTIGCLVNLWCNSQTYFKSHVLAMVRNDSNGKGYTRRFLLSTSHLKSGGIPHVSSYWKFNTDSNMVLHIHFKWVGCLEIA